MSAFQDILDEPEEDEGTEPTAPVEVDEEEGGASAPAVAETPVPVESETSAPVSDAVEAQPITRDDGAVWNENAKRWYLNGKIAAGPAPEVPSAPSIPSLPVAEVPPVAPIAPSFSGDPFEVRGGGRKHAIPGAVIDKDGWLHVAPENQAQVKAMLASGIEFTTNWQREKQQYAQQLKEADVRGEARAAKYNSAATMIWDHIRNPEWMAAAAQNPEYVEILKEKLGIALQRADLTIPQVQAQPEQSEEQTERLFVANLGDATDEVLESVPPGLFTPDEIADLKANVVRHMRSYAAEHEGELVIDMHELRADITREVKNAQRIQQVRRETEDKVKKQREAAAWNAANTPKVNVVPPKKPTPKLVPAGTAPSGKKPDWDKAVKDAFSDDDSDE